MGGMLLLLGFLGCGVLMMDGLFADRSPLTRVWLGLCAGLMLMMWLPALLAFALRFTALAQGIALGLAAVAAGLCRFFTRSRPRRRAAPGRDIPAALVLALVVPLTLLSGYLQYTHILRQVDGTLHVGQSTYGDLCLHLGIATSLRDAPFPPDYSLLPGTRLGYPFLADSMVTSMLLWGAPLALSFTVTGTLMMALVFLGFTLLAWELIGFENRAYRCAAVALAYVLMFINGGLGFLYALDGVAKDASSFRAIFTGFYATPTNQPALNLRWVNVICDMMIPQRTLLTGWMAVIPALYMLSVAVKQRRAAPFVKLGIWAGGLPLVHTHSFLALGLISVGAMAAACLGALPRAWESDSPDLHRGNARMDMLRGFAAYGLIAVVLAAPQLLAWSVPQTLNGHSLRLRFNWVNNQGDGRLIDGYCWFWIKNVGIIWLMMIPAALSGDVPGQRGGASRSAARVRRMLALGALCVYIVAELIQFQPNEYDNNKLFYVAYMVMMPAMGAYLVRLWDALRPVRGRAVLAAAFLLVSTLSGALSIGREVVSDYQLFGRAEVSAAAYIEEELPPEAVFLTGQQHNNAVAALTGRRIVCGTGSYLYFHGLDYSAQQRAERLMLESPADSAALFEQYGVDYAYISSYERANFAVDEDWFESHCPKVYAGDGIAIYAVSDTARAEVKG